LLARPLVRTIPAVLVLVSMLEACGVEEEGLPPSLALLPVIESSFQADAGALDGGRGLWQLQVRTARRFGLVVGKRHDDRLHPERATRAAARYLSALHERYGDWPLALAAYNAGEGRVDRALGRHPGASFWELAEARHLPRVSCDYVPRFLAVVRVVEAQPGCS
jgi:membrane-bound lytic murein transglycosylase D